MITGLSGYRHATQEMQAVYLRDLIEWTDEAGILCFVFEAFDEAWKVGAEGDVGAYWGLWDKDAQPKFTR